VNSFDADSSNTRGTPVWVCALETRQ
jgi:hypothetical protein